MGRWLQIFSRSSRNVLLLGAGAMAVILAILLSTLIESRQRVLQQGDALLRDRALLLEEQVSRVIQGVDQNLLQLLSELRTQSTPQVEGFIRQYLIGSPQLRDLLILNPQGQVVAVAAQRSRIVRDLQHEPFVQALLSPEAFAISPYISHNRPGRYPGDLSASVVAQHLVVARRWHDSQGQLLGIVAAVLNPDFFIGYQQALERDYIGHSALLHYDGAPLFIYPYQPIEDSLKHSALFSTIYAGSAYGTLEIDDPFTPHIPSLLAYRASPRWPLVVTASAPMEKVLAPWYRQVWRMALVASSALLVVALFSFALSRQLRGKELLQDNLERNLAFQTALLDAVPIPVHYNALDGYYLGCNRAFEQFSGISAVELLNLTPQALLSLEEHHLHQKIDQLLLSTGNSQTYECKTQFAHNPIRHVLISKSLFSDGNGQAAGIISAILDITERRQAEERLHQLSQALEQSPMAVMLTNLEGHIEYVNTQFEVTTGYSRQEVLGRTPALLKSGQTPLQTYRELWQRLAKGLNWRGEFHNRRKNGELFWEYASISALRDSQGLITHYLAVKEDITLRKAYETQLEYQANYDNLTGLPNRLMLCEQLKKALERNEQDPKHLVLMFIDLDHFKDINDTLGHLAGDQLLQIVARRLQHCLRDNDMVARLGGDEFAILMPDLLNPKNASQQLATRVLEKLNEPISLGYQEIICHASIGITFAPDDGHDLETLLRNADTAMYHAKLSGRNSYCFFTQSFDQETKARARKATLLHYALPRNELSLRYQPVIDLHTNQLVGVEALLRWQNPELGQVPPAEFVPIAEESDLIIHIGEWVLQQALREQMQQPGHYVAINIASRQLQHADLPRQIAEALASTGFPAQRLVLELTESSLIHDSSSTLHTLQRLKAMGIRLAIDDFGTGYSSLSYLKRFPFDLVKIDASFIRDCLEERGDRALIQAMVAMSHALGMSVIAEGVERAEQHQLLNILGCEYGQGFLFSKPLELKEFQHYLHTSLAKA